MQQSVSRIYGPTPTPPTTGQALTVPDIPGPSLYTEQSLQHIALERILVGRAIVMDDPDSLMLQTKQSYAFHLRLPLPHWRE